MRQCHVLHAFQIIGLYGGPRHSQRLQDPIGDEAVPILAAHIFNHLCRSDVHEVAVPELLAEAVGERFVGVALKDLFGGIVGAVPEQIAIEGDPAGAVGEEVLDRHAGRDVRIGGTEFGEVLHHRIIEIQLPFIHQQADRAGGEGLADGCAGEDRVGRDLAFARSIGRAVAVAPDQLAILHDADRQSGLIELFHGIPDVGVQRLEVGLLLGTGDQRGSEGRYDQESMKGDHAAKMHDPLRSIQVRPAPPPFSRRAARRSHRSHRSLRG